MQRLYSNMMRVGHFVHPTMNRQFGMAYYWQEGIGSILVTIDSALCEHPIFKEFRSKSESLLKTFERVSQAKQYLGYSVPYGIRGKPNEGPAFEYLIGRGMPHLLRDTRRDVQARMELCWDQLRVSQGLPSLYSEPSKPKSEKPKSEKPEKPKPPKIIHPRQGMFA